MDKEEVGGLDANESTCHICIHIQRGGHDVCSIGSEIAW